MHYIGAERPYTGGNEKYSQERGGGGKSPRLGKAGGYTLRRFYKNYKNQQGIPLDRQGLDYKEKDYTHSLSPDCHAVLRLLLV